MLYGFTPSDCSIPRAGLHSSDPPGWRAKSPKHLRILEDDIERVNGFRKTFGDETEPLVLAVRGGSVFSMLQDVLTTVVFEE